MEKIAHRSCRELGLGFLLSERGNIFFPSSSLYSDAIKDQLADGSIDDKSISDNGDMQKVIAIVILIACDFASRFPHLKIAFTGSTAVRTKLYSRILKKYYQEFSREFTITALVEKRETIFEVDFDPGFTGTYLVYFIKRKT